MLRDFIYGRMAHKVLNGGDKQRRILQEEPNSRIAAMTEKRPEFSGSMIMVGGKCSALVDAFTNSANAALRSKRCGEVSYGEVLNPPIFAGSVGAVFPVIFDPLACAVRGALSTGVEIRVIFRKFVGRLHRLTLSAYLFPVTEAGRLLARFNVSLKPTDGDFFLAKIANSFSPRHERPWSQCAVRSVFDHRTGAKCLSTPRAGANDFCFRHLFIDYLTTSLTTKEAT